jgi:excisionase family DNA binding protein
MTDKQTKDKERAEFDPHAFIREHDKLEVFKPSTVGLGVAAGLVELAYQAGLQAARRPQGREAERQNEQAEYTTQEAANFLNVSRPFVVKEMDEGRMPHFMVGAHRRIKHADLMKYRDAMHARTDAALQELADIAQENDMGYGTASQGREVPEGWRKALHAAVSAIYFDDSSDYSEALWVVVRNLAPELVEELERDPRAVWEKTDVSAAPDRSKE